ncbi:MAG: hypothetical protein H8E64_00865 [Candidatus Marinimicrobia bacterium]|nr:hypothetical protein [Candidatus Neomarinimicrobiota bacterium]
MKINSSFNHILFIGIMIVNTSLMAVNPHGTTLARGKNVHSGNKVRTTFYNYGLLGRWMDEPDDIGGEWPINSTHEYIGDVGILVGSEIMDQNDVLRHSVVTTYSPRGSEMNLDDHWGWEPLMGYFNDDSNLVAMSHMGPPVDPSNPRHPNTWPNQWPDKLTDALDPGWSESWNGYFGKNQKNAEQESYFIMDDANDEEFSFFPDTTDMERKGLGLNATVRGLQWNHIMAEDVLFWLYDIKNIGHKDHHKMIFGAIVGTITGGDGDSQDDYADFDKNDDIAYSYDHGTNLDTGLGGVGAQGWSPVGLAGYAFLESPGNSIDGIDNDGDGSDGSGEIITESLFDPVIFSVGDTIVVIDYYNGYERTITTMPANGIEIVQNGNIYTFVPGIPYEEIERNLIDDNLNGIIDENNGYSIEVAPGYFEDIYLNVGQKYIDYLTNEGIDNLLIDESRSDGIDNDGDWDFEKDDVGLDGAPGSGDTFYGEGDGQPTSGFELMGDEWVDTGFPGEPNIDKTDIDESDQIGLSSFYYFAFGQFSDMGCDDCLWNKMAPGYFNKSVQNVDADFLFGSGYFPLPVGETERFSIAMLFGDNLPDLIRNKQTVQTIYNQNYNFAKAPDLPTVWAFEGDGYITIYWDDRSENSYDRLSGYDFEGYKIYKATDTEFTDSGSITDAFGSHKFNVAEKQFDLVNEYEGFFPIDIDGILYDLGDNSGLVHAWTDTNVLNGHRYYYAVTAYDHGNLDKEILPAETSKFVTIDKSGKIQTAQNVISIVPEAHAAGYVIPPANEEVYPLHKPRGTGSIVLNNIDPSQIPENHNYQIYFKDSRLNGLDDDGDWVQVDDSYANNRWDSTEVYFDFGLDGLPNTEDEGEGNGEIDWLDYGVDGTRNQDEPGFNPWNNPDPSHDNYVDSGANENCSDGWDNDGDGEIDELENGECADWGTENDGIYQLAELGEPIIDGNALFDKDVGSDGCRDEFEDGFGGCLSEQNPSWSEGMDPNSDNYNILTNPSGTEGNQQPDLGEPDVDLNDLEEMVPITSHFMVVDVTESSKYDTVVTWTQALEDDKTIFNGMQLLFDNHRIIQKQSSRFIPKYDKEYYVLVDSFSYGGIATIGVKYPRDMKFIFSDSTEFQTEAQELIRTTGDTITFESINVNYSIVDPYDDSPISFAVFDQTWEYTMPDSELFVDQHDYISIEEQKIGYYDAEGFHEHPDSTLYDIVTFAKPGHFSFGDRIIILESMGGTTLVTWGVSTDSDDSSPYIHIPVTGDTLDIRVTKPFSSEDKFGFVSNAPYLDQQKMKQEIHNVKVVPNPYIAGASWEGQNPYATGRGPRAIHFNHLPSQCKITIFNLAGELVDVLFHDTVIEDGSAEWDMLTKENLSIAYGIYLYYIEPISGGQNDFEPIQGKFAVIK